MNTNKRRENGWNGGGGGGGRGGGRGRGGEASASNWFSVADKLPQCYYNNIQWEKQKQTNSAKWKHGKVNGERKSGGVGKGLNNGSVV